MATPRFDRSEADAGSGVQIAPAQPPNPFLDMPSRYECLQCGAHTTGPLARATGGKFCSTCGGNQLVPIVERASGSSSGPS